MTSYTDVYAEAVSASIDASTARTSVDELRQVVLLLVEEAVDPRRVCAFFDLTIELGGTRTVGDVLGVPPPIELIPVAEYNDDDTGNDDPKEEK